MNMVKNMDIAEKDFWTRQFFGWGGLDFTVGSELALMWNLWGSEIEWILCVHGAWLPVNRSQSLTAQTFPKQVQSLR